MLFKLVLPALQKLSRKRRNTLSAFDPLYDPQREVPLKDSVHPPVLLPCKLSQIYIDSPVSGEGPDQVTVPELTSRMTSECNGTRDRRSIGGMTLVDTSGSELTPRLRLGCGFVRALGVRIVRLGLGCGSCASLEGRIYTCAWGGADRALTLGVHFTSPLWSVDRRRWFAFEAEKEEGRPSSGRLGS